MIRQARENLARYDWAKTQLDEARNAVQWVLEMPDEELWEFIPPAEQPRALNVRFGVGCPVHGAEVFKVGGHYPWIMDRNLPFKVKCPVGGEIYPSNDFKAWGKQDALDTRQKYVDDGNGWIDEEGNHYWFVGHYIFWQRWRRDILPVIPQLAFVYELTGDAHYAHKAAVMLARVASEYPKMDYRTQSYHNGRFPSGYNGKILDLDWEGGGTVVPLTTAYDHIYDALGPDAELAKFLAGKGISNAREFIEANFLQEAARAIEANIIHGNMNYQNQLALVATALDNRDPAKGLTTEQMVDWIMHGGGEMNTLLYNGVSRDGAGSEESIGYTTIWTRSFFDLAEKLKPLGYDLLANPRLKKMADFYIQTTVADKFSPRIGDSGGGMLAGATPVWNAEILFDAYKFWPDPIYAKALNRIGWPKPSLYEKPEALDKIKKDAASFGTDLGLKTRDLGGYGLCVLESGEGDNRRAVSMFYGSSGAWHGHLDRLNIEMWSHGKDVLPEIGYPLHWGYKADYWTRSTPSHYCVLIDEERQKGKFAGHLNLLATSPEIQVMDASAEDAYRDKASLYRRTVAMVDVSPEDSYLVDIFRVKGGKVHDYSFHGLPFGEFGVTGLDLGPAQQKGTLMGEDVEFGKVFDGMKTAGYQYLFNVRRGRPAGKWSANWLLKDMGLGLRMTMLPGCADEVIVADSQPDLKPGYPEKMEYVLARRNGGESAYVSIIEPYQGKLVVRRVQPLQSLDKTGAEGFAGVRVDCKGRTDYILSSLRISDVGLRIGANEPEKDIVFHGEFGAITEDAEGLRAMFLVNGRELRKGGYGIRAPGPIRAKVRSVDYRGNSITLDQKLPIPDAVVGQVVIISNSQHSTSYTVTKVETKGKRSILHFGDISPIEGLCEIKSVDEAAKSIQPGSRLSGYGIKWDGKRFPGYTLLNEDMTAAWRITEYSDRGFTVQADGDIAPKLTDSNGDGRKFFYIADIGPGDEVMIPAIVSVKRKSKGVFEVKSTIPYELIVPESPSGG
jgi:hypothetical protein